MPSPTPPLILFRAAALRDAMAVNVRPGVVAVREGRIVAAGDETTVRRSAGKPDRVLELGDVLLLPGMVNAHVHLDLTHQPRAPYGGDFIDWLKGVIQSRISDDHAITAAVHDGLRMSQESGIVAVADIAGSIAAVKAMLDWAGTSPMLPSVSFLEVVGFGSRGEMNAQQADEQLRRLPLAADKRSMEASGLGLQPHAPYSTGLPVHRFAAERYPFASTHLAETVEEAQFIRDAAGPFADLLKRLGKWDDSIVPQGVSPVQHLRPVLERSKGRWIVAHCNHVDDADIQTLAATRTSVAYCPVASDYFHHRNHRYREMLEAGVNVCLGADSIICQPDDEPQPLSILAQMRHLYRRDRADPQMLLKMATCNGAKAIGIDGQSGTLHRGKSSHFAAVRIDPDDSTDPLIQMLLNREPAATVTSG